MIINICSQENRTKPDKNLSFLTTCFEELISSRLDEIYWNAIGKRVFHHVTCGLPVIALYNVLTDLRVCLCVTPSDFSWTW